MPDDDESVAGLQARDVVGVEPMRDSLADHGQDDLAGGVKIRGRLAELIARDLPLNNLETASGVEEILHELPGGARQQGQAHQPAGGLRRGNDVVGAGLAQDLHVLRFTRGGDDRGVRREASRCQSDEDRGVVLIGGDDDPLRTVDCGIAQDVLTSTVADDSDETVPGRLVHLSSVGGDDDDLVPVSTGVDEGLCSSPALDAVADDDGVVVHGVPPSL
ncbi:MAG TPA: hypothetical protein DCQ36_04730 [Actinobacteria bacterium]|nr:hypothetical protein [Actinomycetota bacterium]